ncbi:MAG TPA: tetratricopeptide repeat protein [Bacteroidales bacterium]|nr:tetratricopeptide repeat protein [Bacteroidales bacterium]
MKDRILRYIFLITAGLLLAIMLPASRTAGISCDEIIHYGQSEAVYNYFATRGNDKTAIKDSDLNLKYYGQSYDNFVTIVTKWLGIKDIYTFRNMMSALAGWLTILVTALFAAWLRGYLAGIVVLLLFSVSPTFLGHSFNNLKDVPFALAYISAVFFSFRFIIKSGRVILRDAVILTFGIAFCISIRAGGIILICYLFLFLSAWYLIKYLETGRMNTREAVRKLAWISAICLAALLLSTILWPYALQDPLRNIWKSYTVMAHYPATFRQIFEGKTEWSDFMPWYYLPKSMAITIPVIILAGFVLFFVLLYRLRTLKNFILYGFLAFTVLFPVLFAIIEKANLYSSWRQFLFVYPGIVILSASGIIGLIELIKARFLKAIVIGIFAFMAFHPVKYMFKNHPYEYIYYNELTGGLRGAYTKYETDYYYTSQAEASRWLKNYLAQKNVRGRIKVAATYSVSWDFRDMPDIETSWIRYEERSMQDWDYAIVVNRYIPLPVLRQDLWPPDNAIHVIYADSIPICAVLERKSREDYLGYAALNEAHYEEAEEHFRMALRTNAADEMIFYNFAGALFKNGKPDEAMSALGKGLGINPESDIILMYLGNIAKAQGRMEEAKAYYEKVIDVNRKYFEAYVDLAKLLPEIEVAKARELLMTCLTMNPGYKDAIIALGDTYRNTDPAIAQKYYEQAKKY